MKKILKYSLLLFILFLIPITTVNAKEKTLGQWKTELNKIQKQLEDTTSKIIVTTILNGNTFPSFIASTIVYVCNFSPNACSVVQKSGFVVLPAFFANIGVPVNPNK